jgi:uncharacterized membrane protein
MTNLIVASFTSEADAIEASHKLVKLESHGAITVYEKVVLKKQELGAPVIVESNTSSGLRTVSGMTLGSLAGAVVGPIGFLVGLVTGTLIGAATETKYFDFSEDFSARALEKLQPGEVAIVAEVYESNPAILDNALESLGGVVSRSNVDYEHDKYDHDQMKEIENKIADKRKKIKSSLASEKSKILQKIEELKEKRQHRIAELKEKHKKVIAKIKASIHKDQKSHSKNKNYKHQKN